MQPKHQRHYLIMLLLLALFCASVTSLAATNLVQNPGFEESGSANTIPGWRVFSGNIGDTIRVEEGEAYAGSKALVFDDPSTSVSVGLRSASVPAQPGDGYNASVFVHNSPGSKVYLYLDFLDKNSRRISAKTAISRLTGTWEEVKVDGVAPDGTAFVSIILFSQGANVGVSRYDQAALYNTAAQFSEGQWNGETFEVAADVATLDYTPGDLSVVTTNPPAFVWVPITGAASYMLEISTDAGFAPAATTQFTAIDLSLFRPAITFDAEQTWYWRVYGVDKTGHKTAPSMTRSFKIAPNAALFPLPDLAEVKRRLPTGHPRLFVTPQTLPTWRAESTSDQLKSVLWRGVHTEATIALFEPLPAEPPYTRPGGVFNEAIWQQANRITANALSTAELLSFTYMITGDAQMGAAARRWIMHIASWDPVGNTGAHNNSDSSRPILQKLSRAYTWAYGALTPQDRQEVQRVMRIRGNEAYQILRNLPYESKPYASHPTGSLAVLGEASIAFFGEIPEAEAWFDYLVKIHFAIYPPWGGDAGGYSEGHAYWNTTFGRALWYADALKAATGLDMYQMPFFKNTGDFKLFTHPPYSKIGPFGDHADTGPTASSGSAMGHLANVYQNEQYKWYADALGVSIELGLYGFIRANLYDPTGVKGKAPENPPTGAYYPDIGWVVFHQDYLAPVDERLQFMFKSSPYGSYSHSMADQNSFTLEAFGEPLAISSGYRPWYGSPHHIGWTKTTQAQNALLVDGQGQMVQSLQAKGQIVGYLNGDSFSYTAGAAHTAYMPGQLDKYLRHVVYLRPDLFVLFDDIQAPKASHFSWLLHAYHPMHLAEDGQGFALDATQASLKVKLWSGSPVTYTQTDEFPIPLDKVMDKPTQWHLTATTQEKANTGFFLAVLQPLLAGAEDNLVTEQLTLTNGEGVRISDAEQTSLVLFRRQPGWLRTAGLTAEGDVAAWRQDEDGTQGILLTNGVWWQAQSGVMLSSDTPISTELTLASQTLTGSIVSDASPGSQPFTISISVPAAQVAKVSSSQEVITWAAGVGELRLTLAPGEHHIKVELQ